MTKFELIEDILFIRQKLNMLSWLKNGEVVNDPEQAREFYNKCTKRELNQIYMDHSILLNKVR